ncbi:MAG: hypothetical protein CM15mV94_120 [uncultured marine virus]|nr:MAG: hypothetical protein CM15mV94_120 [uncultured marine virus]
MWLQVMLNLLVIQIRTDSQGNVLVILKLINLLEHSRYKLIGTQISGITLYSRAVISTEGNYQQGQTL